jgi:hypothetical protein
VNPIDFPESNKVLTKPESMTDEECSPLHVFNDGSNNISCWSANLKERLVFLFTGKMWLNVLSGHTQPPVWLCCDQRPFLEQK